MLLKLPRMLPYVAPGRAALQPALERPLGRIYLAGDYLGGFYTDTVDLDRSGSGEDPRSAAVERSDIGGNDRAAVTACEVVEELELMNAGEAVRVVLGLAEAS